MAQAQPNYQAGAPAVLNDSAILDLTQTQGAVAQLSSQKLSNVYGCPIAIKEIRFFAKVWPLNTVVTFGNFTSGYDLGAILNAFVSANNVNLMQNPVHLRSLGTLLQSTLAWPKQSGVLSGDQGYYYTSTFYRWVFPRPLFLPRNASLDIKLSADPIANRPVDTTDIIPSVKVNVAAVGTLQPDLQGMMAPYPYVAEFAPNGLSLNGGSGKPAFAMGNDPIFRNVFANPIMIDRIVASAYANFSPENTQFGVDILPLFPNCIGARLWDSRGNNIAGYGGGNPINLGTLVNPQDGNWFIERTLPQYEWLNVELNAQIAGAFDPLPIWYPRVAFHGSHMQLFAP